MGGKGRMPSSVALTVSRYRPERESEPTFQTYEIPFRKDWVVLDALNHVKDSLDGSLSFRWSCRMGVCGSCGMKVNGTPKLTCATFLAEGTKVCPKHVDPAGAIQQYKLTGATNWVKSLLLPWSTR